MAAGGWLRRGAAGLVLLRTLVARPPLCALPARPRPCWTPPPAPAPAPPSGGGLGLGRPPPRSLLRSVTPLLPGILHHQVRTVIQCSLRKGKRKTVKAVVDRFLRLHCGLWLRRRAGYKKKLWKKTSRRKRRLREQVFCNKTQSRLLDKMTTSFWKRRNWYAGDPFQKYHDRTNLPL